MRAPVPHHRVMEAADRAEARAEARADAGGAGHPPRPPAGDVAEADPPERPEKPERREGRGRLSSMDLAAELAPADIAWAIGELNASRRTQDDIRGELNDRLAVHGIEPISRAAFNRRALKQARLMRRLNDGRELYASVVKNLTPGDVDEHNLAVGELLKGLCLELGQEDGAALGAKGTMELARAYLAVVQAQKISAERRAKLEAAFKADAEKAIQKVAKARGVSAEATEALRRELFGISPEAGRGA